MDIQTNGVTTLSYIGFANERRDKIYELHACIGY